MSTASDDALYFLILQQMCHSSMMAARIQSHLDRQHAQTFFNFLRNFRKRCYIINIDDFYIDFYNTLFLLFAVLYAL